MDNYITENFNVYTFNMNLLQENGNTFLHTFHVKAANSNKAKAMLEEYLSDRGHTESLLKYKEAVGFKQEASISIIEYSPTETEIYNRMFELVNLMEENKTSINKFFYYFGKLEELVGIYKSNVDIPYNIKHLIKHTLEKLDKSEGEDKA